MNDLSWFLYFAGALPSLATAMSGLTFVAMLAFIVLFLIYIGCRSSSNYNDRRFAVTLKTYRHFWAFFAVIYLLTFAVPNKETFYAIAVSEMGEEVLNSKIGNKATAALEAWLDRQIEEPEESPEG